MFEPRRVTHGRGTSWEITYRVEGRQVRRHFPTKTAAVDAFARARTETNDGLHIPPVHRKVTVEKPCRDTGRPSAPCGHRWATQGQVKASPSNCPELRQPSR